MKTKLRFVKSLLVMAALCLGSSSAWAAVTSDLEVTGYKTKAFYDFKTNSPAVLPTEGDVRYREGYGLYNFGSGTRSGAATISVANGDIIVIQKFTTTGGQDANTLNVTINCGSVNSTVTSSINQNAVVAYDITSDATSITFSCVRYVGINAVLVLEKDNSVATADYTINYKASGVTVKTVTDNVAVGTVIPVLSSFVEGGKKYVTDGGQASSLTVAAGGSTLDINVTEAAQHTCTINAKSGEIVLATTSGTVYDGEDVKVFYKKAYKNGGTWYMTPANGSYPWYAHSFSSVTADASYDVSTYAANENIVYYGEVEEMNLEGSFAANGGQTDRYSNGVAKRLSSAGGATPSSGSWVYTDNIPAGVYTVTLWARNQSSSQTATIPVYLRDADGNLTDLSTSFEEWAKAGQGEHSVEVTIPNDGKTYSIVLYHYTGWNNNLEMDYVYVTLVRPATVSKTITAAGWATYCSPYALDFTGAIANLTKAYMVTGNSGSTLTLTPITTTIPANTGILLEGSGEVAIPVVASSDTNIDANKLVGTVASTTLTAEQGYVLTYENSVAGFRKNNNDFTLGANTAYLPVDFAGARSFDFFNLEAETTGINAVENAKQSMEGIYNLAGQRVAQPTRGLYIVNGKKIVVK